MNISEEQLSRWAKAPSETEEGKCQNTINRITEIVKNKFGNDVSVFLQGSYRNRTNVRQDSDVDIVVLHKSYYFPDVGGLSESDKTAYWKNFTESNYTFPQFKNDIHALLKDTFGTSMVTRKNKCIRVNGNDYRVNADVVPCFVHKRFCALSSVEVEGVELVSDAGIHIHSFPKQHYDNGVTKNNDTEKMYKSVARILKNIRNELMGQGTILPNSMPSFFLECLVWNVLPNTLFKKSTYTATTRAVIATIWNEMREPEKANNYAEISDLKWLFRGNPNRTHQQALEISQTFSKIFVYAYYERSQSESVVANFAELNSENYLFYTYDSAPNSLKSGAMQAHKGTVKLKYLSNENKLIGTYFNSIGNSGEVDFEFEQNALIGRFAK
ncbi:MAG: nucleotidyltransferase domain-containing protein [Nitrospirae bacterium]|nr:nucleotidyltransferase domain-containing protein [Nitrospirota bacterium]